MGFEDIQVKAEFCQFSLFEVIDLIFQKAIVKAKSNY